MFSREQIDTLYYLVEKGVITEPDVKSFLEQKLKEVGFVVTPPAQPVEPVVEQPAEVIPPAPEQAPEQPTA